MKPQKMKAYASFSEWQADQSAANRKLITALTRFMKSTAPGLAPAVKWGQGCWKSGDVPKVYFHAEPDHIQVGFYAGSQLDDPDDLLVGNGKHVRHVKVFPAGRIPRKALAAFIRQVL